jgi:hypothetical protein
MRYHLALLMVLFFLLGCSNFEELRKAKFEPDHAVKYATTFLPVKAVNGKFIKTSLIKDQPLMLLKRGFGYSLYQLYNGSIGEVANDAVRSKEEGETFEDFYNKGRQVQPQIGVGYEMPIKVDKNKKRSYTVKTDSLSYSSRNSFSPIDPVEAFPILNNSLESVEPELPEW